MKYCDIFTIWICSKSLGEQHPLKDTLLQHTGVLRCWSYRPVNSWFWCNLSNVSRHVISVCSMLSDYDTANILQQILWQRKNSLCLNVTVNASAESGPQAGEYVDRQMNNWFLMPSQLCQSYQDEKLVEEQAKTYSHSGEMLIEMYLIVKWYWSYLMTCLCVWLSELQLTVDHKLMEELV